MVGNKTFNIITGHVMLRFLMTLLLISFSFNANAKEYYLKQLKIPNVLKIYSKAYNDAQNSMQPQSIENIYKSSSIYQSLILEIIRSWG